MKMAILGCGKMVQAIVLGNKDSFINKEIELHAYTPSKSKAQNLAEQVSGKWYEKMEDIPQCDYYLLGCKPQNFSELADELAPLILKLKNKISIISILAGINTATIFEKLGTPNIIRVMPNTPCMIGEGMTAIYFSPKLDDSKKSFVDGFFKKISKNLCFEEEDWIDKITPFSGSGPAYIFEVVRILSEKLSSMGVPGTDAQMVMEQTFIGALKLLQDSNDTAEALRDNVTSKNGVTYEALKVLKENELEKTFGLAMDKAYERAVDMSKGNI